MCSAGLSDFLEPNYAIRLKKHFFVTVMKIKPLFVGKLKYCLIFATLFKIRLIRHIPLIKL